MPINPVLLKLQISECFSEFQLFLSQALIISKLSLKLMDQDPNEDTFPEVKKWEKHINNEYSRLSSEIGWYINKLNPSANNLRFFLATHLSLKDLERFGDYSFEISKVVSKHPEILNKNNSPITIYKTALDAIDELNQIFQEQVGRVDKEQFRRALRVKERFYKLHSAHISSSNIKNLKYLSHSDMGLSESVQNTIVAHISVLSKVGRSVDHFFNVIENFYHIDNPDDENITTN